MTIEERANQAAQWKATGIYNCAQAVTQAFADQIPVEAETLKKLGAGYAAGMGCMESTCGALIGAVMAAGILTDGKGTPAVSRQLVAGFQEKCGATMCTQCCAHTWRGIKAGGESVITTILWDVDGTLLDFLAAEKAAIRTLFAEFGFGECTDEAIARYSKINRRYWEKLENGELTKPEVLVGRFREFFETEGLDVTAAPAFNERYQVCLGDTIVFRDDSYEIVKSLRGRVKQYVVSNGTVLAQTKKLRLSGLGELMDGIFLSEELGAEKPNAAFFDQVFEAIEETDRKKILIVGDSLTSDIRGGNLAQIVTCWYNPNGQKADSTYRIDAQIQDLQEVIPLLSQSW